MIDLAIIGGGPAGLTAGLYATRGGLKDVIMFEKGMPGGQITGSSEIENYPGISHEVTGMELMENWPEQSMRFGMKHSMDEVTRVTKRDDGIFEVSVMGKDIVEAKSVVVATGSTPRRAGVEGEEKLFGKGVSTCATCDGFFYKGKEVAVLGGGDTALEEALYLANICSKVYLIHRRDTFRASPITIEKVKNNEKIELILNSGVKEILGDMMGVTGVVVSGKDKSEKTLDVPGIFVFVGMNVNNSILLQEDGSYLCDLDDNGNVIVDLKMKTSVKGLFAAGDIRIDAAKQVVCAAGDGAVAGIQALEYVND
ncbi:thioredoxin-disulfide reductase [Sulfurospirillum arcachonense]|uniref:thioredoxin-disulfide reductase n=1 Tax=Sulfurospirillum arcachonense TaxID=57666 RepID=UPI000469AC66|nr:thioredoxin-disulfide reductase [Sulfurospirillum arcachonense]